MLTVVAQAWQSWKSAKAVAALSAIALAVGIGSTTAIYTVVNTVMLKPLPYEHGERFVALFGGTINEPASRSSLALPDLLEYQRQTESFDVFGWFRMGGFNLTSPGQPQHVNGTGVTPGLARGLGVSPIVGQWFTDDTGAVVSHSLWTRLGSDRGIVGKAITLNGRTYTITGVMPPGFRLPLTGVSWEELGTEVWIGLDPSGRGAEWTQGFYISYARMKPGVTFAQAEEEVRRIAAEIARQNPTTHPSYTARLVSLRDTIVSGIRPTLVLLFAAAGLLLLITCANGAGLLLARSVARARETAIRVALGATQRQLALQFFWRVCSWLSPERLWACC